MQYFYFVGKRVDKKMGVNLSVRSLIFNIPFYENNKTS